MSFEKELLQENVKRQSKRLSKLLSCQLGQAQEALSICLYGCVDYSQLVSSLNSGTFENPQIALAALSPSSDLFLFNLFESYIPEVLRSFEKKHPEAGLTETDLISLFGLSYEDFKIKTSK